MTADYRRKIAQAKWKQDLMRLQLPLVLPPTHATPNLESQEDVRPTDPAPIFRAVEGGLEMAIARWWLIPWFHKGTMKEFTSRFATFNAKGETLTTLRSFKDAFAHRRCLVPADGWYEFSGDKGAKTKWLFTARDEDWFCFAGLWDRAETADGTIESFTIVTQAPGPAMRAYHHRAPLVLRRAEWAAWVDLTADVGPILARESEDRFDVEKVR
jgi:putative SOS response-associated peptidase YedK